MGGKLLSKWNLPEKRLCNAEYAAMKNMVVNTFVNNTHNSVLSAPSLRLKESHGDLDIIIGVDNFSGQKSNILSVIYEQFGIANPHINTNVISFPVNGFQVDATCVPSEYFHTTYHFTSWGDLSNLVGRTAHKLGLVLSHEGLKYYVRESLFNPSLRWSDNDHVLEEIIVSKNWRFILNVLGYDVNRWSDGFDTQEDVYCWIAESRYFDPDIFKFENLNHINKTRNRKRPMYAGFVEWCEQNSWKYKKYHFESKPYYLPKWCKIFPKSGIPERINNCRRQYKERVLVKSKVNGMLIKEWFSLDNGKDNGKLIGNMVAKFKDKFSNDDIISMDMSDIKNEFIKLKAEL